jgi:hypothetical protein
VNPATGRPYSATLPDCRAYEMVSPAEKNANQADTRLGPSSQAGEAVTFASQGSFAGELSHGNFSNSYFAASSATGWQVSGGLVSSVGNPTWSLQSEDGILDGNPEASSLLVLRMARATKRDEFVFIEDDGATIARTLPVESPGTFPPLYRGASSDLSDLVLNLGELSEPLLPADTNNTPAEGRSLYEITGAGSSSPALNLVGVDNSGTLLDNSGIGIGSDGPKARPGEKTAHSNISAQNAISAGGSTVFFNTQTSTHQLYARIDGGQPGAVTVNVAGTSSCSTSAVCNVTSPVTFWGASSDGSKVFFTAAQAGLVAGDTDATNALYECALPGDASTPPTPSGTVNPCPDLNPISVTGTTEGADVQGVVHISNDGLHVYFVATGVLASNELNGKTAQKGADNLYVYEPDPANPGQYTTAFIAGLPSSDAALWGGEEASEAQTTPDGRYLVFASSGQLTPDDTSTVAQVFRYDAQTGELLRVSTGVDGYDNNGNTDVNPAAILAPAAAIEGARADFANSVRAISEDGSYIVFTTAEALSPQDTNNATDVYEWHEGQVSLLSGGQDPHGSSFLRMTASGRDVFFNTDESLVPQDTGSGDLDLYDARIDGGFPAPAAAVACSGEACQGPLAAAPLLQPPASTTFTGGVNLTPPALTPAVTPPKKSVAQIRKEKLTKALKACRKKSKRKRASCVASAHKKYGATK